MKRGSVWKIVQVAYTSETWKWIIGETGKTYPHVYINYSFSIP